RSTANDRPGFRAATGDTSSRTGPGWRNDRAFCLSQPQGSNHNMTCTYTFCVQILRTKRITSTGVPAMQCRLSRIPDLLRITVLALLAAGPAAAAHAEPVERDRTRLEVGADDFICMQQMTPTGRFFVDNLYG